MRGIFNQFNWSRQNKTKGYANKWLKIANCTVLWIFLPFRLIFCMQSFGKTWRTPTHAHVWVCGGAVIMFTGCTAIIDWYENIQFLHCKCHCFACVSEWCHLSSIHLPRVVVVAHYHFHPIIAYICIG